MPFNFSINLPDLDPINKNVELTSWYDRENLLFDTLHPQNLFLNRIKSSKSIKFIKDDPHVQTVIQSKIVFYNEFIQLFCNYLKMESDESKFKAKRTIYVHNLTPNLLEIFKNFHRYSPFNSYVQAHFGFNIKEFENCKF